MLKEAARKEEAVGKRSRLSKEVSTSKKQKLTTDNAGSNDHINGEPVLTII